MQLLEPPFRNLALLFLRSDEIFELVDRSLLQRVKFPGIASNLSKKARDSTRSIKRRSVHITQQGWKSQVNGGLLMDPQLRLAVDQIEREIPDLFERPSEDRIELEQALR